MTSLPRSLRLLTAAFLACGLLVGGLLASAEERVAPGHDNRADRPPISIIDGDTMQIGGDIVQLFGIDAPELGQLCRHDGRWRHCGFDAAFELRKLFAMESNAVRCGPAGAGNGPSLQSCLIGQVDVAHALIASGYALAAAETNSAYSQAEAAARDARLGLWHDGFVAPARWRAGKRLEGEADAELDRCPIKTMTTAGGQRHYVVPTDDGYRDIVAAGADGPCYSSDEAAREAGWTRPGQTP